MGRGWKRVRKLSTAPVPSPTIVFQSPEAKPQGEELRGDQRERAADPDLDGPDRHAGAEVSAVEIDVLLVAVESGRAAAAATVLLSRSVGVAGRPFSGTAGVGGRP